MAIQVGEKAKKKKERDLPENLDLFLPISIVLFAIMAIFYATLFYLSAQAEETKVILEKNIAIKEEEIPKETEKEIKNYYNIIEDFKLLIEDHHRASSFFEPLQRMMHPRVMISSIDINFETSEVKMSGKGDGFISVGQQFYVLKTRSFISSVSLDRMSKGSKEGESHVDFGFTVVFDKDIFKF
jgi:hypothetical protein